MDTILFGSQPVAVTRESLMAMPPHQRSECLALLRETGKSELTIGTMLGIGTGVVSRLLEARHLYSIPRAVEERVAPEEIPSAVLEKVDISRNGLLLLRRIGRERQGWTAGKERVSQETGLNETALERAMSEVLDKGLAVRLGVHGRGQAPCYCVTPMGRVLLTQAASAAKAEA
ncbi:hypothetical protein QWJ46_16865 [Rhizobium sp. CBN3]|uniref:hypothetical protein n=1 Tax=Rhizobium sp. CBN3 TaxID=3058045 RepID=UPI0026741E43|nr:hypothetical protein [Rhizobium sp. CBN3]MDO3434354.1 hypothetical protein [Rhizobium sp. CBN3]